MTKALRFTKSELANAALIAREHGVAVRLGADGSILVFTNNKSMLDMSGNEDLDRELEAFEAKHGHG